MNEVALETESSWSVEHRRLEANLPGAKSAWVSGLRQRSMAAFEAAGFPGPRVEAWRSLNLRPFLKLPFATFDGVPPTVPVAELEAGLLSPVSGVRLVFVNGVLAPDLSREPDTAEGVRVDSLARLLESEPASLEPYLQRSVAEHANPFALLNTAVLRDGAVVRIGRGAVPEHVVHLVFLTVGNPRFPAVHPRVLVVAEPGSRTSVVEEYLTLGEGATFTNPVSELLLGPNAHLRHLRIQHESEEAYHFATVAARLERDASLESVSVALGAALSRTDLNVGLYGEGGSCTLNGLYAVGARQTVDHHTFVDHAVPHTSSRQLYKGLLDGHARAVFNGQILIREGAQKTDATQANPNLLLSRDALVNTNPQLRIFADDVKCKHGATIGQMDEDRVFYLRSRGLSESTARRLLMRAFAAEILETLDEDGLGPRLTERVTERFV